MKKTASSLFNETVPKIKRAIFLSSETERLKTRINDLKADLSALRKVNGRFNKAEKDVKIYDLNSRLRRAEKELEEAKKEHKTLKETVYMSLADAYALTDEDEKREKIKKAAALLGGKIVDDEETGGVLGETEVVAVRYVKDRRLKGKTARLLRAGVIENGFCLIRPQAVAYFLSDEKQGEEAADDSVKELIKKQMKDSALTRIKDAYFGKNTVYAVVLAFIYAAFAAVTAIFGFGNLTESAAVSLPAVAAAATAAYLAVNFKERRGGYADNLALLCFLTGVAAFCCLPAYTDKLRACVFPSLAALTGGIFVIARAFAKRPCKKDVFTDVYSVIAGAILAAVLSLFEENDYLFLSFGGFCAAAAVFCSAAALFKPRGFYIKCGIVGAAEFFAFALFSEPNAVTIAAFCSGIICLALLTAGYLKRSKNESKT